MGVFVIVTESEEEALIMKALLVVSCLSILLSLSASASELLEKLSALPSYYNVKLSPDGKKLAATVIVDDRVGMITMDTRTLEVIGGLRPTMYEPWDFYWANNKRLVVEVAQRKGWREDRVSYGELYAMNYDGSGGELIYGYRAGEVTSGTRIKKKQTRRAWGSVIDPLVHDKKHILINSQPISSSGSRIPTVVRLDVRTGVTKEVIRAPVVYPHYLTDVEGVVRIAAGKDENNVLKAYSREADGDWQAIADEIVGTEFRPLAFDRGEQVLKFLGNTDSDRLAYYKLDLKSGEYEKIYENRNVDITSAQMSAGDREVIALRIDPGYSGYLMVNKTLPEAKLFKSLLAEYAGLRVNLSSLSKDGKTAIVFVQSDVYPGSYFLYRDGELRFLFNKYPDLKSHMLVESEPVEIPNREGVNLGGYLTRASKNRGSLVVMVHGGPHGIRDYWAFNPEVQMLVAEGIHVLQVNYRGSGGYGHSFERAGYREWGRGIQNDILDATLWAVDENIADPDRICIMGGSFGAYSAVQSASLEPDLFRCVVAVAGVYDLPMMYKKGDIPRQYLGKAYLEEVLGDDLDELAAYSPVNHVGRLKADLLIVHGEEDERTPIEQAEALMSALEKAGIPFESHIEGKEGHGILKESNRLVYFDLVSRFLNRHLSAR